MNNKILAILFTAALLLPMALKAQTDVALDPELGGRVSLSVDKKITKGLHITLEEEVRFDNNFGSFDRLQTTLALNYKVHPNIKLGLGYALINGYGTKSESFKNPRHRFLADATGTLHLGNWNLSLKERFQVTRRTGDFNVYQNPQNALTLKSRLKAQYKGFGKVQPYTYFEVRNYLNAPVIEAAYDGSVYVSLDDFSEEGEAGWFLTGFNGGYVNRLRGALGAEVKLDKRNTLDFYLLGNYVMDKEVDANAEGTKLKSYTKETGFRGWIGAGYEFAF
ncbi:MAG: DUF2490 domain-containing protein [Bacteroidales bacterium]|nr:DUF2490 domain-containing protein [Bacteroidales bacterium]